MTITAPHTKQAFSLVELSIVLVILGLLTGGILAGQSLIRAAEMRSVVTDLARYQTATLTFRDKYFALPGDITNATSFWGDRATGTAACADTTVTDGSPGTCNGNGNGRIGGASPSSEMQEYGLVWQHMAEAGLIEGVYSGHTTGGITYGETVPNSKISRGVFWLLYNSVYGKSGNLIHLASHTGEAWGPLLTAEETWGIDKKLDDGKAYYGSLRAWNGYSGGVFPTTGCVATGNINSTTEVTYTLTSQDKNCAVTFFLGH